MKLQNRIIQRQNSNEMLRYQYAARFYYNRAEIILVVTILLSIINLLFTLAVSANDSSPKWVLSAAPILINIFVIILYIWLNHVIQIAADLRNHFDEIVLGLKADTCDKDERIMQALIDKAIVSNREKAFVQMKNTGHDDPRGVKDWYEFSKDYPNNEVVFECQRQNQWWNKKMLYGRLLVSAICFLTILALAVFLCLLFKASAKSIVLCFLSAVAAFIERIIVNVMYIMLSIKIDHFCESYSHTRNRQHIIQLQKLIAKRRRMRVLELNFIHKKKAPDFSDQYKRITRA